MEQDKKIFKCCTLCDLKSRQCMGRMQVNSAKTMGGEHVCHRKTGALYDPAARTGYRPQAPVIGREHLYEMIRQGERQADF